MTYVPAQVRQLVIERANGRCEYCRYPQEAAMLGFEMEHIIAEKHGGATEMQNMALACPYCNRAKGTDLGSIDPETGLLTAFFNPRTQQWSEHFRLEGTEIVPLTAEGRVTVVILQFNDPARVKERARLIGTDVFDET
jgi:glutaredoxin